jgi:transcriptional regulator with XRE-family HTH domain
MSYPAEDKSVAQRFGENLLDARRRAGYSQVEVARRSSLHPTYISHIEQGRCLPRVGTLVRLAGSLGVSADELLRGIEWTPSAPAPLPPSGSFAFRGSP